jgi:hypothetical protein
MIDRTSAERLAAMGHALRPDWPVSSLMTFLAKPEIRDRAYRDIAVALAWVACDSQTQTPARLLEAGPWWRATQAQAGTVSTITIHCPHHPEQRAWNCQACTDEAGDPATGVAAVRDALKESRR